MPCPQPDDPPPSDAVTAHGTHPSTTCVRCKTNPAITILRDSIYCQACALAVFYQKAKAGLEYARGAGLSKYVAAAKAASSAAGSPAESRQTFSSSTSTSPPAANGEATTKRRIKHVSNGSGNAEENVSANIAIAFSGGISSRALLRSATQYFRPATAFTNRDTRRRKARGQVVDSNNNDNDSGTASISSKSMRGASTAAGRFNEVGKIYVFYIDDSAVVPNGVDRTEQARRMVEEEGCADLHFVGLKLHDVFRADDDGGFQGVAWRSVDVDHQQVSASISDVSDPRQALKDLFSSLCPVDTPRTGAASARTRIEDLHRIFISTLLRRTAKQYDCAALLLGDTATRISIRLIEDLAKGAGHKIPVQGSDAAWIDDLLIVRPLKTHLLQEVVFYTSQLNLDPLQPEQPIVAPTVSTTGILASNSSTPAMDKSSIARLTETFILNLEKGVPSTVTTIGKTGSKLVLNGAPGFPTTTWTDVAHSTSAFRDVGPSVSLSSRLTHRMANVTLAETQCEPRIGSRGIKLAQLSANCVRWNSINGCALCAMPSQHPKARWWKRDITISSLAETAPRSRQTVETQATCQSSEQADWLELCNHLCYACLLVLSPAISSAHPAMLPSTVLHHIHRSTHHAGAQHPHHIASRPLADDHELPPEHKTNQAACATHNMPNPIPQPLKPPQIKAHISEFLIE